MRLIPLLILMAILFIISTLNIKSNTTKKFITVVFIILISALFASRSLLTQDTLAYFNAFEIIDVNKMYAINETPYGFEIGYTIFMQLTKLVFKNPRIFFFFVSSIVYVNFVLAYSNLSESIGIKKNVFSFLLVFTAYYGIFYAGVVLRAGISISFIVSAVSFLVKKKYIIATLLFLLSISFHTSAIITIPIFIIINFNKNFYKPTYIFVLMFLLIIHLTQLNVMYLDTAIEKLSVIVNQHRIFEVFYVYLADYSLTPGISLKVVYLIMIGLFAVVFNRSNYLYGILNIYMFGLIFLTLLSGLDVLSRATDFYIIFSPFLVILTLLQKHIRKMDKIIYLAIFTISSLVLIFRIIYFI